MNRKTKKIISNLIVDMTDKMLEKHGESYQSVIKNPKRDNVEWYSYYTMTEEEWEEWRTWCIKEIMKRLKFSKKRAEKEFDFFNLNFGLKISD